MYVNNVNNFNESLHRILLNNKVLQIKFYICKLYEVGTNKSNILT